jgi:hypothetical protein
MRRVNCFRSLSSSRCSGPPGGALLDAPTTLSEPYEPRPALDASLNIALGGDTSTVEFIAHPA